MQFERKFIQFKLRSGQKTADMYEIEQSTKKYTNMGASRNGAATLFFCQHVFHAKRKTL